MNAATLVTGGRGALGRHVVRRLLAAGTPVRLLGRQPRPPNAPPGVDWVTGDQTDREAIHAAVDGVDVVVHCATDLVNHRKDGTGGRVLVEAARAHGQPHVVYVSIVGVDRISYSYYRVKRQVEETLTSSGLPVSIQRVTQFHELFLRTARALRWSPLVPVPAGFRFQPIAADEVAARLVELAFDKPRGRAPDLGGPEARRGEDLVNAALRHLGARGRAVPIPLPGKVAAAYRAGHNLTPEHADGRITFEEFLG